MPPNRESPYLELLLAASDDTTPSRRYQTFSYGYLTLQQRGIG